MSQLHASIYSQYIGEWAKKDIKDIDLKQSFDKFISDVQVNANYSITFDSSIVDVFQILLKKVHFQTYDLQKHLNQNRQKLFKIADNLRKYEFIGKKQYKTIINYRLFYLKEMAAQYLQIISENSISRKEKLNLWRQLIPISNVSFWNFIDQQEIEDEIIKQLYNKGVYEDDNKIPEAVINRKRLILNPNTNIFMTQSNVLNPYLPQSYLLQRSLPQRGNRISIRNNRQNYLESNSQETMTTYERFQTVPQTNFSMWMNEQKYQKMNSYMERIEFSSNQVVKFLTLIAFQNSLFYNRAFKYLLHRLQKFITHLQNIIKQFSNQIAYVDLFGSLRSTLSLVNEYDVDITAVPLTSKKRSEQTRLLFKFHSKLHDEERKPHWLKRSFVNYRDNIPIPFIKINIDDLQIKKQFQLKNVAKIDLTVGNKTALINSQMFSYFAQKQQILLFCLLVKLWAKSKNIINSQKPMEGLSSYGVILMCIFFLMKTKQLDFLNPLLYINPQKISMPQVFRCDMQDIETNFCQFLQFYGQQGLFHQQRMMASLLADPPRDKFDEGVIINMYDFIDQKNPGRLSINRRQFFYEQFKATLEIMQTRDPTKISSLFIDTISQ